MSARLNGVLDGRDLVAFHRRLQRADRIDLGDDDAAAGLAQRGGRALADVAEAGDERHLAGHHHVGAAADGVDQRFAAAVEVVELRLGDAVVDVDGREQQLALLGELVEAVHARGRLLGDAADRLGDLGEPALRLLLQETLDEREEDLLFLGARPSRGRRCRPARRAGRDARAWWRRRRRRGSGWGCRRRASRTGARCSPSTR